MCPVGEEQIRTKGSYSELVVRNYVWIPGETIRHESSFAGKAISDFIRGLDRALEDYSVTEGRSVWPQSVDVCVLCGRVAPAGQCPDDGNVPTLDMKVKAAFPAYRP